MTTTAPDTSPERPRALDADEGPRKACPTCHHLIPASRGRCEHCLSDVRAVLALSPEEDARIRALPPQTVRRRLPRFRHIALATFVLLIAGLSGWRYAVTRPAPPVPVASSTERVAAVSATRWDGANGDYRASRSTAALTPWTAPAAWQFTTEVRLIGGIVADEERVYVAREDNRVVAIDQRDGREAWSYEAPIPVGAGPTLAGDRLYQPLRNGHLVALDAKNGAVIWERPAEVGRMFFAPVIVADGTVFGYTTGAVFAWDAETGDQLWNSLTLSEWATVPPAVSDKWIVVTGFNQVEVFSRANGAHTYNYAHRAAGGVILTADRIFSASPNFTTAVDPASQLPWWEGIRGLLNQLWIMNAAPAPPPPPAIWVASHTVPRGGSTFTVDAYAPAFASGLVITTRNDGAVIAIDAETGKRRWEAKAPGAAGAALATGELILVPTKTGLLAFDRATGAERGSRPLANSGKISLAATARALYVLDPAGTVTALR